MENTLVPIFITGGAFAMTVAIVGIVAWANHRARELRHQTIRLALEKGQQLPPELLRDVERSVRPSSDLRRGIILTFLGTSISAFLWLHGNRSWASGLVVLALGLGFLVAHLFAPRPQAQEPRKM